jgi:RNA polymerase sigma factor (sigma-70 family)
MSDRARRTVEAVWRIESPRLIASLARLVRSVELAEDFAQDALVRALEKWPVTGLPENPGAWLMRTARNRAIDYFRRSSLQGRREEQIRRQLESEAASHEEAIVNNDGVHDDLLRLMFIACHPVLSREARSALTLRLLAGLTTEEIARAFLHEEATVAQRITRAKKTLSAANVPFEVPPAQEREKRLHDILEVIYLIFNEGYSATRGEDWIRPQLCEEAMRLGRILSELMPDQAETHSLVALMELHASRFKARLTAHGDPILLMDQDRGRWDHLLIQHGLKALARAEAIQSTPGLYYLQAAIAACHARARKAEETDWERIVLLYECLYEITGSPVIELNRAVAISMARGAQAGLDLVEPLARDPALSRYHLLSAVRGDLLFKLKRYREAALAFEKAAQLTENMRERSLLLKRAGDCSPKVVNGQSAENPA